MLTYLQARFSAHAHSSYDYKCVSECENLYTGEKPRGGEETEEI